LHALEKSGGTNGVGKKKGNDEKRHYKVRVVECRRFVSTKWGGLGLRQNRGQSSQSGEQKKSARNSDQNPRIRQGEKLEKTDPVKAKQKGFGALENNT